MTGFDKQRRLRLNTELIKYKMNDGDEYGSGQWWIGIKLQCWLGLLVLPNTSVAHKTRSGVRMNMEWSE
jgi:hypothetical protein